MGLLEPHVGHRCGDGQADLTGTREAATPADAERPESRHHHGGSFFTMHHACRDRQRTRTRRRSALPANSSSLSAMTGMRGIRQHTKRVLRGAQVRHPRSAECSAVPVNTRVTLHRHVQESGCGARHPNVSPPGSPVASAYPSFGHTGVMRPLDPRRPGARRHATGLPPASNQHETQHPDVCKDQPTPHPARCQSRHRRVSAGRTDRPRRRDADHLRRAVLCAETRPTCAFRGTGRLSRGTLSGARDHSA